MVWYGVISITDSLLKRMADMRKLYYFGVLLALSGGVFADDPDRVNAKEIRYINFDAEDGKFLMQSSGNWEVSAGTACTPLYISISTDLAFRKELMSIALAAFHSGTKVRFIGDGCENENSLIFSANYIVSGE